MGYQIDPELVEDFMLRAGATRADLAAAIKSSKGYVSDILGAVDRVTGEKKAPRRQPSPKVLKQIADFLDVHPRALLLRALPANSVGTQAEPASGQSVSA